MSVYICESVNLNGGASDEASPFSFNRISGLPVGNARSTEGHDTSSLIRTSFFLINHPIFLINQSFFFLIKM